MARPTPHSTAWRDIAGDVVVSFVEAVNAHDIDRLIDLFAQDAHVNDQLRDFWGKTSIANWIRREIVGEKLRMTVIEALVHFGDVILSAEIDGDFDKTGLPDPLALNFIFALHDGKITRLLILMTRAGDEEPDVRRMRT